MIFFLYGPDTYRARQKLNEIFEHYRNASKTPLHIAEIDCKLADFSDFKNAIETVSLFGEKKLIVLHDAFSSAQFEKAPSVLAETLRKGGEDVVLFVEQGQVKKTSPLFQLLRKEARSQGFSLLEGAKLTAWIRNEFQSYGVRATLAAQEMLAQGVGNDLWRLSNEIRKLVAFQKSKGETSSVTESDIRALVRADIGTDIFATIDAVARKNKKESLALLWRHLQKGDSPYYLLAMLTYQFRTVLEIKDMIERKVSYSAIIQKTKLHPFVFKKGYGAARNFTLQELKRIYQKLFRLDLSLKTGKIEPEGAFDLLLTSL